MEIQNWKVNDNDTINDNASTRSNVDNEERKIGEDASSINIKS
jgi:hypothetical protein